MLIVKLLYISEVSYSLPCFGALPHQLPPGGFEHWDGVSEGKQLSLGQKGEKGKREWMTGLSAHMLRKACATWPGGDQGHHIYKGSSRNDIKSLPRNKKEGI